MSAKHEGGFVLVVALILLTVLMLVAVIATRSASLEVQMAANSVSRIEAFTASEAMRRPLGEIMDVHTFARGWPQAIGGTVSAADFAYTLPPGLRFCAQDSRGRTCDAGTPRTWYLGNSEAAPGFDPATLDQDADYVVEATDTQPLRLTADISVYKLITDLNPGAGAAMVAGYEGVGKSAGAGGGRVFYYASSVGNSLGDTESEAETGANFRHVIRN
jgi:hypothetical protein